MFVYILVTSLSCRLEGEALKVLYRESANLSNG